jgi:hypothetical protein
VYSPLNRLILPVCIRPFWEMVTVTSSLGWYVPASRVCCAISGERTFLEKSPKKRLDGAYRTEAQKIRKEHEYAGEHSI